MEYWNVVKAIIFSKTRTVLEAPSSLFKILYHYSNTPVLQHSMCEYGSSKLIPSGVIKAATYRPGFLLVRGENV